MKTKFVILILIVMLAFASVGFAQDDGPPSPVTLSYESGTCHAQIPMSTPYHPSTQEASIGSLNGGTYEVIEASAIFSEMWVGVHAEEVADADLVWVNASDSPVKVTTDCLFNSGYGAQTPAEADSPPSATTVIKYPYGGCLLQSTVGTPSHPSVQEAASGEITATQVIVLNITVYQDNQWIGVYGGELGLPVYVTPAEFIEGNFTALTASCLYIPMVASTF